VIDTVFPPGSWLRTELLVAGVLALRLGAWGRPSFLVFPSPPHRFVRWVWRFAAELSSQLHQLGGCGRRTVCRQWVQPAL